MLWQLRPPKGEDLSFIYNSWLKSLRDAPAFVNITHTTYYKAMHDCMEAALKTSQVVVACAPGEEDVIYGYGVAEQFGSDLTIHFIYNKHPFRRFGVAKAIEAELLKIPHETVSYSCHVKNAKLILKERKYVYDPWRLWSRK